MKKTATISTIAGQMSHESGVKGIGLWLGIVMFLLLLGTTVPFFHHSAQAVQGTGSGSQHAALPVQEVSPGVIPPRVLMNLPTVDVSYTSSSEKSLGERRGHRRHGSAAASSAAAGGDGGAAASSAAASGGDDGGAAASSAAASGDGGAAASSAAAA